MFLSHFVILFHFSGSAENEKERAEELERAVEELRKLLNEASAEYGALERAKAKADEENAESLLQSTTLVKELKDELDNVNQLLQASAKRSEYNNYLNISNPF